MVIEAPDQATTALNLPECWETGVVFSGNITQQNGSHETLNVSCQVWHLYP